MIMIFIVAFAFSVGCITASFFFLNRIETLFMRYETETLTLVQRSLANQEKFNETLEKIYDGTHEIEEAMQKKLDDIHAFVVSLRIREKPGRKPKSMPQDSSVVE